MSRTTPEDEYALIRECVNGNDETYAVLIERYKNMVYHVAYRMLGDEDAAKDAAQESFIAAYAGLKDFNYKAKFSSWLYRIALNKCRDYLRAKKDFVPVDEIAEFTPGKEASPEQAVSSRQTADAIQRALKRLPPEYREVIVLKHLEELDYEEVADITGSSIAALKVRAHRGREMLKDLLEEMGVTV